MKVFIDLNGEFYKAEEAKHITHAEKPLVSADLLEILPDDGTPMSQIQIDAAVAARISTGVD